MTALQRIEQLEVELFEARKELGKVKLDLDEVEDAAKSATTEHERKLEQAGNELALAREANLSKPDVPVEVPVALKNEPKKHGGKRASRLEYKQALEPYLGELGKVSPYMIAMKAGPPLTAGYVRAHCRRHGIEQTWRGHTTGLKRTVVPTPTPTPKPVSSRKRRVSKLDPFLVQIGHTSDRDIAKLAGVTPENVRAYRKRHGVPAYWRGEK